MLSRRTAALVAASTSLITASLGATQASAHAAADCQPFSSTPCLLPFPNNLFTVKDKASATGLRVHLPQNAMPVNTKGARISVAPYDHNDGFSPGSAIVIHVNGLDNAAAFAKTNPAPLSNIGASLQTNQPIVLIDERTGKRVAIWSELDANVTGAQNINLLIHPAAALTNGDTYVVVLRNLKTASGHVIKAPRWFEKLRDGRKLPRNERSQLKRYTHIFKLLKKAKIKSDKTLYEAWDFTVASTQNLTGRLLAIRNNAFAQLGDTNLADGIPRGHAPAFTVTGSKPDPSNSQITVVDGSYQVPCYLVTCGPTATTGFHYSSGKPDATPTQIRGNVATALFECVIPSTASPSNPARISLYGHGLLGSRTEVTAGNVEAMATEHNIVFCATDWWGLASGDTLYDASALADLNKFPVAVDRLQQGVLNTLFLGRLMRNPAGLATNAAFEGSGKPVVDTSNLYYDGNSQGGIEGGLTTAVAPDFTHAVLGVTGMDYGNLLVDRSIDFAPFGAIEFKSYTDPSMDRVLLDLMQQQWDRGDPDGYAAHMTTHPLPDTPKHVVLMQIAYGDFQVSMFAGAAEARTIGASLVTPALGSDRARDKNLFWGIPAITHYPFSGSAVEIWDSGPGRVQPPPFANIPPTKSANNNDPHEDPRNTPLARQQKSYFLQPNGQVVDVCAGSPCHSSDYTP
ncbi:MAG TPA: hypothetical protein VG410_08685 [Solirubrobacteraceae bacterium]|nr:hypothetical protein [Solirubrobacteraceae bacterium]